MRGANRGWTVGMAAALVLSAGVARAQDDVLGMGEGSGAGAGGAEAPVEAGVVGAEAGVPSAGGLVFRKVGNPLDETVFAAGDTIEAVLPRELASATLEVVDPRSGKLVLTREFSGSSVRFEADLLPGKGTGRGYSVFATTANGDAAAFHQEMQKQKGKRKLPTEAMDVVLDEPSHGDHRAWSQRFFHGAGIGYDVAVRSGGETLTGSLLRLDTPNWLYFSGHYPKGSGGTLGGADVRPDVPGAPDAWKGKLEVLIMAACYAGDLWTGSNLEGIDAGAGIDGRLWWERFRGTLLAYRGSAPSTGADRIARRFLQLAATISRDPDTDKEGYSRALAKAWMKANGEIRATYATAIDASGNYYWFERGVPKVMPMSKWQTGNDAAVAYQTHLAPGLSKIRFELAKLSPFRPATKAELQGTPAYLELMADGEAVKVAGSAEALSAKVLEWWRYELHVYFETDLRLQETVWAMAEANGNVKPGVDEVLAMWTPSQEHRSELSAWRQDHGRRGLDLMVEKANARKLVEKAISKELLVIEIDELFTE